MRTANQAWLRLLAGLASAPHVAPRGLPTLERLAGSVTFSSRAPLITVLTRKLNYRFAAAEALWMVTGRDDAASLARLNPKMASFSDDGVTLAGAYGPRFRAQLQYVLETLSRDPESRQAVVEIWRPVPAPSKDIPCTLSWQFILRAGRLHLVATMRSSDAWLGVPYDAFSFAVVLQYVAGLVGAEPGDVTITMGSSHIYAEHWEPARQIVDGLRQVAPEVVLSLEPLLKLDARVLVEGSARAVLDHDAAAPYLVRTPGLPGWSRLLEAVQAKTSLEALAVLRG